MKDWIFQGTEKMDAKKSAGNEVSESKCGIE
jgi:hypothetical protein